MTRQVQSTLIAGDTFRFTVDTSSYESADYALSLKLNGPSGSPSKTSYSGTANANGTSLFDVRIAPAVTANLAPGIYAYAVVVNDASDEFSIEHGTLTVEARADVSINTDHRSHNQKVYESICAVIEGRATQDQQSYTIAGRTLVRTPIRDLLELKKHYQDLVFAEQKKPGAGPSRLVMRFN